MLEQQILQKFFSSLLSRPRDLVKRPDGTWRKLWPAPSSKYDAHQGEKEKARRVRQREKGMLP